MGVVALFGARQPILQPAGGDTEAIAQSLAALLLRKRSTEAPVAANRHAEQIE
ncbi:hypothetical protein [Mesorhizobium sp. M1365]|uniref:hypothetical protein n=1 Tax=Mesorhizobium sp. M1365 TaxID=2957090 RepID=UPI00333BF548